MPCYVTWRYFGRLKRLAKHASSVGKTFLSLRQRDFHFNFQHLLRKKALVGESISFIKCTDSLEKVGWIK